MLLFYTDIDFTTMEVLYRLFKKTFYFVTFHCSHKQTKQSQSRNHGITFPGEIKNCVKVIGTAHICTPAFLLHSLHIKHSYGVTALYLSIAMLVD